MIQKPERRKKEPKPLRRKEWGVQRRQLKKSAALTADFAHPKPVREKKTKHERRPREAGFMAFCHARGCEMKLDADLQRLLGIEHRRCRGRREFAHLSDRKRYDVGDVGACLCEQIHKGIDGREGGKSWWYVELDWTGQNMVRMRLANRARAAWDALSPEERAGWEERAAAERVSWRGRRVVSEA